MGVLQPDRLTTQQRGAVLEAAPLVTEILEQMGVEVVGTMACCPFCSDSSPSLSIYNNGTRWKCHSVCKSGGTSVDLYAMWKGLDHVNAVDALYAGVGLTVEDLERMVGVAIERAYRRTEEAHTQAQARLLWDITVQKSYGLRREGQTLADHESTLAWADKLLQTAEDTEPGETVPTGVYPRLLQCARAMPGSEWFTRQYCMLPDQLT